eukprot:139495_1
MALVQVEENILQSLPPQDTQPLPQTGSTFATVKGKVVHVFNYGMDTVVEHRGKSGAICFVLLALIAGIVLHAVYKGEGHSHAVPMDAPAGAKVCRDVTTLMADNG